MWLSSSFVFFLFFLRLSFILITLLGQSLCHQQLRDHSKVGRVFCLVHAHCQEHDQPEAWIIRIICLTMHSVYWLLWTFIFMRNHLGPVLAYFSRWLRPNRSHGHASGAAEHSMISFCFVSSSLEKFWPWKSSDICKRPGPVLWVRSTLHTDPTMVIIFPPRCSYFSLDWCGWCFGSYRKCLPLWSPNPPLSYCACWCLFRHHIYKTISINHRCFASFEPPGHPTVHCLSETVAILKLKRKHKV